MRRQLVWALAVSMSCIVAAQARAHANYIGYSGAPGSSGRCASSCHGASGGTIEITGFPTEYVGDQTYTIAISHAGGSSIRQFNGSCRIGAGSANAGVIASGTNTVTYNTGGETNGIHLSSESLDSGTFLWTAPAAGTGEVRLYVAGHQGSYSGANSTIMLVASEQTSDVPGGGYANGPVDAFSDTCSPNPFSAATTIRYVLPVAAPVLLEIYDPAGRRIASFERDDRAGAHQLTWDATGQPSGIYFYRIEAGPYSDVRKMLLSK